MFKKVWSFFPIDLLFSHIKYNFALLLFWILFFGIINSFIGVGTGLPYLFLSPEYRGESDFMAFLLLGAGIGGFIVAFHIYSYFQLGSKYPFIVTLSRPFTKFMINNSIIPLLFIINLIVNTYYFQKGQEYVEILKFVVQIVGLLIGIFLFAFISLLYFFPGNKEKYRLAGVRFEKVHAQSDSNIESPLHRKQKWYKSFLNKDEDRQYLYIGSYFKIKKSRKSSHYNLSTLHDIFEKNHINASIFEVLLIISYVIIGLFRDNEFFQFPAAVSIMMLFTIIIMLVSALFSWFRMWTFPFIAFVFLSVNFLSTRLDFFSFKSHAFGISYDNKNELNYGNDSAVKSIYSEEVIKADYESYINTLENWKAKTGEEKPKLIILNTSGGGLRSTVWTFEVLQELDRLTSNKLSENLQMITGASGGMIGAAYYRDLIIMENEGEISNRSDKKYLENISKDLLNRLAFSIPTSDLFFRFQSVEINGNKYNKDRGYAFEEELKDNLGGALNKNLGYYEEKEKSGEIPTMIFAPTIINDGRRLLISSQEFGHFQFLSRDNNSNYYDEEIEYIEYLKYFKDNNPKDIRFTTVLRMNATFPYIMPMVTLPTKPEIHIMDAGIRDNYGVKIMVRYLVTMKDWIEKNTGGVIVLKIRDNKKGLQKESKVKTGLLERLFLPFGNMYGNFPQVQDFNQDELFSVLMQSVDYPIDIVTFNLREAKQDRISLSWHLTKKEKAMINNALISPNNKYEMEKLLKLLFQ